MDKISVLLIFPILCYMFIVFRRKGGKSPSIHIGKALLYVVTLALVMGLGEVVIDKLLYAEFLDTGMDDIEKDYGWAVYTSLCKIFVGTNIYAFFVLTAFLYCGGYLYFGSKVFGKTKAFLFLVIASGLLGFSSYGTNTLRQGLALSIMLCAFCQRRKIVQIMMFIITCAIHLSMSVPIFCFYFVKRYHNTKRYLYFWVACFVLSAYGFSIVEYGSMLGGVDYRFVEYSMSDGSSSEYNVGFRLDFIIYSMIPLLYSLYIKNKCEIDDIEYVKYINMYILSNAFWLLVIRLPYTDRIAYLSWFCIPILLYYPYSKDLIPKRYLWAFKSATFVMMFVIIALSLR